MGTAVILPDLILPSRVNERWLYSGMDSLEHCNDKRHFQNYPYTVDYVYNSRGFRDQEWPDSEHDLRDAIWCIGDSFTVGLGQPVAHIWPEVLGKAMGRRCINISMDGASNDWIWRRTQDIWTAIQPLHMVIMWSYTHRRELQDPALPDEQRRLFSSTGSDQEDLAHWISLVNKVHQIDRNIVQCTIPFFHPVTLIGIGNSWRNVKGKDWPECPSTLFELENLPAFILTELQSRPGLYSYLETGVVNAASWPDNVIFTENLDWARDHHHFDILTSQWVVDRIMPRLTA